MGGQIPRTGSQSFAAFLEVQDFQTGQRGKKTRIIIRRGRKEREKKERKGKKKGGKKKTEEEDKKGQVCNGRVTRNKEVKKKKKKRKKKKEGGRGIRSGNCVHGTRSMDRV